MEISVFGGSQVGINDPLYKEAYELGSLLAKAGHTVITGGYIGSMEAISRGAYEAGGHVIGITCQEIEAWRPVSPNPWIIEERRFSKLTDRLMELILSCDAAIALSGGPGTLTEVALMWNLMIIDSFPHKELMLIGPQWRMVIETFFASFDKFINKIQRDLIKLVANNQEALDILSRVA